MSLLTTNDGVKLFYEEVGSNVPIVFVHEFAGDSRSWESQVRHFARRYRCITFNARGYPPSEVPEDAEKYSQDRACEDIKAVMDELQIDRAHVVGLSMGGFAALHFGFTYPDRARSLVVAGCGYGATPDQRAQFIAENDATARHPWRMGATSVRLSPRPGGRSRTTVRERACVVTRPSLRRTAKAARNLSSHRGKCPAIGRGPARCDVDHRGL